MTSTKIWLMRERLKMKNDFYWNKNYMTIAKNITERHRTKIIIHKSWQWYLAEFDSLEQLHFFENVVGFKTHFIEMENGIARFSLSHEFKEEKYFWKLSELPAGVKPIKALCNGSIVTCYFLNDGKIIHWYRPNPNARNVYKPMTIQQHIKHREVFGSY
nr:MAG TPA: hypothetical protein [Caudoviricetes sp.]DAN17138.1 MAG TPA: hypothetical protein [Caudoviricetes sp.]